MKINFIAPLNSTGYGVAATNIFRELSREHEVAFFPIGQSFVSDDLRDAVEQGHRQAQSYHNSSPSLRIWHQNNLAEHVGRGKRVGFPFFEIDPLSPAEIHQMNSIDGLIVASHWAKDLARRCGVTVPIYVAPLGVDRTIFHEAVPTDGLWSDQTVFFNVGKWEIRKGHDLLISAFNKAFEPTDKVVLRMLSENHLLNRGNDEWARLYKNSKMGSRIDIVPRLNSQEDVARFMMAGDIGVFPARSEGWNLDLMEALSLGKHVIASYYSAHTEYLHDMNASLLRPIGMETARDGRWFHGEGNWAKFDEDQLVEHLRLMHRLYQQGHLGVNKFGIETAEKFSWKNTAARVLGGLV